MTELKQYYRSIEKKLPTGSHKKRFMDEFQSTVGAWIEENPEADLETVCERFGTPEKIVTDYTGELDTQDILKKYKLRKWIISIIAGAATLALVIWLIFLAAAYIDSCKSSAGQIETSPISEEILEE